jgi:hypothetical protein
MQQQGFVMNFRAIEPVLANLPALARLTLT